MVAVDTHNINIVWAPLVLSLIAVGGVLIPNQLIMTVICPDDLIATGTCLTVCLRSIGQAYRHKHLLHSVCFRAHA